MEKGPRHADRGFDPLYRIQRMEDPNHRGWLVWRLSGRRRLAQHHEIRGQGHCNADAWASPRPGKEIPLRKRLYLPVTDRRARAERGRQTWQEARCETDRPPLRRNTQADRGDATV